MLSSVIHPAAQSVLLAHDQENWSKTSDGLICAPIGFYRIFQRRLQSKDMYYIAFGFSPEALDLVPHPQDPTQQILRNTADILDPVDNSFGVLGEVEQAIRAHQGAWFKFQQKYGNLYHTDRTAKEKPEYFANKFIRYEISRDFDADGKATNFRVRMRVNPYSAEASLGLDKAGHESLMSRVAKRSLELKSFPSRDECLEFISDDFTERFNSLIEGLEIQNWNDGPLLQNMAIWFSNRVSHVLNQPMSHWSSLFTIAQLGLGKFLPQEVLMEEEAHDVERRAREEEEGTTLSEVAYVDDQSPTRGLLHKMREEVREDLVAVADPQPPLLLRELPICPDLPAYRAAHAIDIIHDRDPVMVTQFDRGPSPIILARTHNGIEVHYLDRDTRYVTYVPSREDAAKGLPKSFEPLFSPQGIAVLKRRLTCEPLLEGARVLDHVPHDPNHQVVCTFEPLSKILAATSDKKLADALARHRNPHFTYEEQSPKIVPAAERGILAAFRTAARKTCAYIKYLLPVKGYGALDLSYAYGALAAGTVLTEFLSGPGWQCAVPLAFSVAAAFATRRVAANATNPLVKKKLEFVSNGLFAVGYGLFTVKFGALQAKEILEGGIASLSHGELLRNSGELLRNAAVLAYTADTSYKNARNVLREVFGDADKGTTPSLPPTTFIPHAPLQQGLP